MAKFNKATAKLGACVALSYITIVGLFVIAANKPVTAYNGNVFSGDINENTLNDILGMAVSVLVYGIGVAAMLGFVVSGVLYLTARDNPQQMQRAKTRFVEVTIGLIAWVVIFAFAQWLVPGTIKLPW